MDSFWSFFAIFVACFSCSLKPSASESIQAEFSTISAAPTFLPEAPSASASSPGLSPDISPLLPTPGAEMPPSPSQSSIPIIPSSPSPPNPDSGILVPGPEMGISPSVSVLPVSSSVRLTSSRPLHFALFLGLVLFCLMQLSSTRNK